MASIDVTCMRHFVNIGQLFQILKGGIHSQRASGRLKKGKWAEIAKGNPMDSKYSLPTESACNIVEFA